MSEYIHYGHSEFDLNQFAEISNRPLFNKPHGGLWGCLVEAKFGWKEWCEAEDFRECNLENSFSFQLSPEANVYRINCKKDLLALPLIENPIMKAWLIPDFEKIKANGIDAIQLNLSGDTTKTKLFTDGLYYALYGWDCDSILVLNKDVIEIN